MHLLNDSAWREAFKSYFDEYGIKSDSLKVKGAIDLLSILFQKKASTLLLLIIGLSAIHAQEVITTSGGYASGSGGTVSYTIGQVAYSTNTGTDGTVTQGVQQPFEISVLTGIEEAKDISLEMVVYPNPTSDFVRLIIENYDIKNLNYQLYNINGSLLLSEEVESQESYISMQTFAPASYFLKVFQGKKEIKACKIIKN